MVDEQKPGNLPPTGHPHVENWAGQATRKPMTHDERMAAGNMPPDMQIDPRVMERLVGSNRVKPTVNQAKPVLQPQPVVQTPVVNAPIETSQPVNSNPLQKYFRSPGIWINLPSQGMFYPPNTLDTAINNELQVYPMTAADELLLHSPDALMNGSAIEQVIRSCCPGIKNPRILVTPDIDVVLLAIRAASYGQTMMLDATCPKCGAENNYEHNLTHALQNVTFMTGPGVVATESGLTIVLRPYDFEGNLKLSLAGFEEAKIMQLVNSGDINDADKPKLLDDSVKKITNLALELLNSSIIKIITPDGTEVSNPQYIKEWTAEAPRADISALEGKIKEINQFGLAKDYQVTCSKCQHTWKTNIAYDPASFFGLGS